jgi:type II secretory pathway component PulK
MKYLGLWTVRQVNVNTAPRHVLEAALTFGSAADAPKIAGEIIRLRQEKPFTDLDEVRKGMFRYSDSIEKCKEFLTTTSNVFTIRVTAVSGVAKVTAVAAVIKEGDKVKQIGVISD